ncbi:hypothetical protein Dimus_022922 [Dionaea muscipula]
MLIVVKEFYAKMTMATILGVPGRNGICEYIKEVWEESRYTKPLDITRRIANDEAITAARRVKSSEMKPFQRFIHFLVMKNVIPRFGKRDTSSFMDLTYMDHLMARRLVNLPRVMMRHMSYVISMKDHELLYGDWLTLVFEAFGVPLVIKREKNLRNMIFSKTPSSPCMKQAVEGESRSEKSFMMLEEEAQGSPDLHDEIPAEAPPSSAQQKDKDIAGVDPSGHTGREAEFLKFQAEFERKRANRFHDDLEKAKAENARLLALLHQVKPNPILSFSYLPFPPEQFVLY